MSPRHPLWEALVPPSRFGRPERTAVRAEGHRVLFEDGRWALCATSGLWNVNLGYGNKSVADAVATALLDASYLTLFRFGHRPAVSAARALLDVAGPEQYGRVLFSTSGGAANDAVLKLARQYWASRGAPERRIVVGLRGSYHGLTYGSHGLSGEELGQAFYGVDRRLVRHVDPGDPAELAQLLSREGHRVAALVVEPVLGSGAYPLSAAWLEVAQQLRREHGFLLVADEVATGFGRTGRFFASAAWSPAPDMLVTSKGLTNGTCGAAAVLASHGVCEVFEAADAMLVHGETQAGTPPTCAAILATIQEMERLDAVQAAVALTGQLDDLLTGLTGHRIVAGHRGTGCFRALELASAGTPLDAAAVAVVVDAVRGAGAIVQPGPSCIQLVPALTYGPAELDELASAITTGLDLAAEVLT